jgi:hypothetical protein
MMVGNYAASLALKSVDKNVSLGMLFYSSAICRYIVPSTDFDGDRTLQYC